MRNFTIRTALLALALSALLADGSEAASFSFLSQSGGVDASGATTTLGSDFQSDTIPGLGNANLAVSVEDGDPAAVYGSPPGYYAASSELHTQLGPAAILVSGETLAEAIWDGEGLSDEGTFAASNANVDIAFSLSSATEVSFEWSQGAGDFNGPSLGLTHAESGFAISYSPFGEASIDACGSLSFAECDALVDVFFGGGTVPAGSYTFSYDLFAFQPTGSCAAGCNSAGGVGAMIIPEPGTALLLAIGLALLASLVARRRPVRAPSRTPTR